MRLRFSRTGLALLAIGWCLALVIAWNQLLAHTFRPVTAGAAVTDWPLAETQLLSTSNCLVLFAHPFCPCTRAALDELQESLEKSPRDPNAHIVFVTTGLNEDDAQRSQTIEAARHFKHTTVHFDRSGSLSAKFGARVSGEVFVFDQAGRRVFHGGITAGRGHRGQSPALDAFEKAIRGESHDTSEFPLFGCSLPTPLPASAHP